MWSPTEGHMWDKVYTQPMSWTWVASEAVGRKLGAATVLWLPSMHQRHECVGSLCFNALNAHSILHSSLGFSDAEGGFSSATSYLVKLLIEYLCKYMNPRHWTSTVLYHTLPHHTTVYNMLTYSVLYHTTV